MLIEFTMALKPALRGLAALRLRSPHAVDPKALPTLLVGRDQEAADVFSRSSRRDGCLSYSFQRQRT